MNVRCQDTRVSGSNKSLAAKKIEQNKKKWQRGYSDSTHKSLEGNYIPRKIWRCLGISEYVADVFLHYIQTTMTPYETAQSTISPQKLISVNQATKLLFLLYLGHQPGCHTTPAWFQTAHTLTRYKLGVAGHCVCCGIEPGRLMGNWATLSPRRHGNTKSVYLILK